MGLEDALNAVKTVYPLHKPWLYKKRKKALGEVRALVEGLDNQETQEYIRKVIADNMQQWRIMAPPLKIVKSEEEGLDEAIKATYAWYQWNPHALDIFAAGHQNRSRETFFDARYHLMFSEQLKVLAETYKEKFGEHVAFGLLEGIKDYRREVDEFEKMSLPQLKREGVQQILALATEYGPDIAYAMSKCISKQIGERSFLHEKNDNILLLKNETARNVYAAYKDAGQDTLSQIIKDMVVTAETGQQDWFRYLCYTWLDENVQAIVKEGRKYGQEIEKVVSDILALHGTILSHLTEEIYGLMEQYKAAPRIFAKVAYRIALGDVRATEKKIQAFSRKDVEEILLKYNDTEENIETIIYGIAQVAVNTTGDASIETILPPFLELLAMKPHECREVIETVYKYSEINPELLPAICAYFQEQGREKITKLSTAVSLLPKGSELYEKVKTGEIALKDIGDVAETIEAGGLTPTPYLVAEVYQTADKQATMKAWKQTLNTFADGNFDATNELHRNLEYTRFRRFVDHEKVKKYIKNHFTYESYESIFRNPTATSQTLSEKDQFEIECTAYEAGKLYDFIERVKKQADKIGRKVVVVPNFSYGYLPVSPIVSHLKAEGIETILGVKVGSTECHENKDVMNSRLFKGHRTELVNEQPIIIVVDGTQHLVAREGDGKGARYPDAHQSYLNQVVAMNDALGQAEGRDNYIGKSAEDCARLQASEEYKRTVAVYKQVADETPKQPYQFALWNTAELEMIVRGNRQEAAKVMPIAPKAIAGPTLVFCNVGVPQEQVPEEMREKYQGQEHQPAYFDDSGRIIAFDFGHDNYGVRYLNRLETEVKNAFEKQRGCKAKTEQTAEGIPEIVQYLSRVKTAPVEESSA